MISVLSSHYHYFILLKCHLLLMSSHTWRYIISQNDREKIDVHYRKTKIYYKFKSKQVKGYRYNIMDSNSNQVCTLEISYTYNDNDRHVVTLATMSPCIYTVYSIRTLPVKDILFFFFHGLMISVLSSHYHYFIYSKGAIVQVYLILSAISQEELERAIIPGLEACL